MEFKQLIFWFFAAVLVFAATMVITVKNPVKAALFLVLAFFNAAGLWLLLQAGVLAILLVVVDVGAVVGVVAVGGVVVLSLFVVMMLDINIARLREGFTRYLPLGGAVAVLLAAEMVLVLGSGRFGLERVPEPAGLAADASNTRALGRLLYTTYAYPFELAALVLLVAIIAAIALTLRRRKDTKYQDPGRQVRVERSERVRLVKMPAEKKS